MTEMNVPGPQPKKKPYYEVIEKNIDGFVRELRKWNQPWGVSERAFRDFLTCGIPELGGYAVVKCKQCGEREKVPWHCNRPWVCPTCGIRRMYEDAADLVKNVLPEGPYRHLTVSYPYVVQYKLGFQPLLLTKVERMVIRVVTKWQKRRGIRNGGGVLFRHRFREDLEMFIHAHLLLIDGWGTAVVWARNETSGRAEVWKWREVNEEDVEELTERIWRGMRVIFARQGIDIGPKKEEEKVAGSVVKQLELFGMQDVTKDYRWASPVGRREEDEVEEPKDGVWVRKEGLHVYASPTIDGSDRENLERLCRYFLRPSFSTSRMSVREDGKVIYRLKHADKAGNTVKVMEPTTFMRSIATLMPGPRQRMKKLFGVVGPRSKRRKEVMPKKEKKCEHEAEKEKEQKKEEQEQKKEEKETVRKAKNWTYLEKKLKSGERKCPRCGGEMMLVKKVAGRGIERRTLSMMCTSAYSQGPPDDDDEPSQGAA